MLNVNTIKDNNISRQNEDNNEERKSTYDVPTKLIFKPYIARRLLKEHELVDIRPDRDDAARTVFVFKDSLKLRDDMLTILKNRRENGDKVIEHENEYDGETKIIFKPYIARRLNHNHRIVDIKADKNDPKRTIFVFADSIELRDDMQRILRNRHSNMVDEKESEE